MDPQVLSSDVARVVKFRYPENDFDELVSEAWLIINRYLQTRDGLGDLTYPVTYFATAVIHKLYKDNLVTKVWDESDYAEIPEGEPKEVNPEQELGPTLSRMRNRHERASYGLGLIPNALEADVKEAIVLGYALVKGRTPPKNRYRPKVRELADHYKRLYFYNPRA